MIIYGKDVGDLQEEAPRPREAQAEIEANIRRALILFEAENQEEPVAFRPAPLPGQGG